MKLKRGLTCRRGTLLYAADDSLLGKKLRLVFW